MIFFFIIAGRHKSTALAVTFLMKFHLYNEEEKFGQGKNYVPYPSLTL
jgi:hypothetical protein